MSDVPRRFAGRSALVTGAAHGIGRATAERLGREGARVVLVDIDQHRVAAAAAELIDAGIEALPIAADVSDAGEVARAVATARELAGDLDVLHNNAGRLRAGSVVDVAIEEWDRTYAVNVRAMFLMCRSVIPSMLARGGGAIVNTASTSGLVGEAGMAAYCSSKGAVVNLTRQLAAESARSGIRVNCVCPGWVPTGFNAPVLEGLDDAAVQTMVEATVPAGRQGTAEEIAAAVAFLASDDAAYVCGHALVVDGGLTMAR
jgi:meso-butanediol dehydrogenase/(S,S)-butanediol dehydrogenase/diacetyl reductase